mmetsp:Transcript_9013/g.29891  ORF Transcript_9013/g.29891 Transcript_9013/m.29891 type:complete len:274 (-) Transcript_9013:570-1391(-)
MLQPPGRWPTPNRPSISPARAGRSVPVGPGVVWGQPCARVGRVALDGDGDELLLQALVGRLGRYHHAPRAADRDDDQVAAHHWRLAVVTALAQLWCVERKRVEGQGGALGLLLGLGLPDPALLLLGHLGPLPRRPLHRRLHRPLLNRRVGHAIPPALAQRRPDGRLAGVQSTPWCAIVRRHRVEPVQPQGQRRVQRPEEGHRQLGHLRSRPRKDEVDLCGLPGVAQHYIFEAVAVNEALVVEGVDRDAVQVDQLCLNLAHAHHVQVGVPQPHL